MKCLSLALVAVLCVTASAETIIGEFSASLLFSENLVGSTIAEFLDEVGAGQGDPIYGEFAYQSDAELREITDESHHIYPADYIWVQIGDRRLRHDDLIAYVKPGGRAAGAFWLAHGSEFIVGETNPVRFVMDGNERGTPVFSNALPLTTADVNVDVVDWFVSIPIGDILNVDFNLTDRKFTLGPACDANSQGDLNGDGRVGLDDFLILSDNFGKSVDRHELGDVDCDGSVQFADFLLLSDHFGQEAGDVQLATVPEPSCLCSFALFICLLLHHCSSPPRTDLCSGCR
jgi:hypothetical protein